MRGEGMRGEGMRGEGMRGEGMRGEGMRGEGMRGEGIPLHWGREGEEKIQNFQKKMHPKCSIWSDAMENAPTSANSWPIPAANPHFRPD